MELKWIDEFGFEKELKNGYIYIKINRKWIQEHRYKMEQFLKRELTTEERIHHIDFDKQNNNIENLMLFKDQRDHSKFHNKIKQFGYTNPIKRQIENRWCKI